jgi:hypothetical protein
MRVSRRTGTGALARLVTEMVGAVAPTCGMSTTKMLLSTSATARSPSGEIWISDALLGVLLGVR